MVKIKILVQGYAREKNGAEFASSTTTFIQDNKVNIVVDPGMDRKSLLKNLKKEGLSPDQIDYVVLTHCHLDHSLLTGIFVNAKVFDDSEIYSFDGKIEEHDRKIPGTSIKIFKTPGHEPFHCSVLVKTQKLGRVVIAGDVFWWADEEEQDIDRDSLLNHQDPYFKDKEALLRSRKKILEIARYIIPGHGKMFRVG